MLVRLRVRGFKNLADVDIRFGAFTCIAGANGVGKSNLLDAIAFLSAVSHKGLVDSALCVRDENGRGGDIKSLFRQRGGSHVDEMFFEADMIIPATGYDDLGQSAHAKSTYLTYTLRLRYIENGGDRLVGGLEITHESLEQIKARDPERKLFFPLDESWRKGVVYGKGGSFITTEERGKDYVVKVHQDGGGGRSRELAAKTLPRTALSAANAAESPTVLLAKREMQSWRLLQLEPRALRASDSFISPTKLGSDGSHLPATIYRMGRGSSKKEEGTNSKTNDVYARIANRLSELIDDVNDLGIVRDEQKESLTLYIASRDGTNHPAKALSDGTLRFLALAVLDEDTDTHGVMCLEEPENGIHPSRIPAILRLLQDVATDPLEPDESKLPIRQVLINTHSPAVVAQVPEDSLLVARQVLLNNEGVSAPALTFSAVPHTWRTDKTRVEVIAPGAVLEYLNSIPRHAEPALWSNPRQQRVSDRVEYQLEFSS